MRVGELIAPLGLASSPQLQRCAAGLRSQGVLSSSQHT